MWALVPDNLVAFGRGEGWRPSFNAYSTSCRHREQLSSQLRSPLLSPEGMDRDSYLMPGASQAMSSKMRPHLPPYCVVL